MFAYLFVVARPGQYNIAIEKLKRIAGEENVSPILGRIDFIIEARVDDAEELFQKFVKPITSLPEVTYTTTFFSIMGSEKVSSIPSAYMFMNFSSFPGKMDIEKTFHELLQIDDIFRVDILAGFYDLAVKIQARDLSGIGWHSLRERILRSVSGVVTTHSYIVDLIPAPTQPSQIEFPSNLILRLSSCPSGKDDWQKFEAICEEIFRFLFVPPLLKPVSQSSTFRGSQRRDLILHIPFETRGFWKYIQMRHSSIALVVECKNLSSPMKAEDCTLAAKYLGERRLGNFLILISRLPASSSAVEETRRLWMQNEKLILLLHDEHLFEMIKLKSISREPETVLDREYRSFFQYLE